MYVELWVLCVIEGLCGCFGWFFVCEFFCDDNVMVFREEDVVYVVVFWVGGFFMDFCDGFGDVFGVVVGCLNVFFGFEEV